MKKKTTADGYKKTTKIVHGPAQTGKWDFSRHVVPPLTSSSTYRLESVSRGARGFCEYGQPVGDDSSQPVYIYDRLDDPTRELLEGQLAQMEGGESCLTFASGMAAISGALGCVLKAGDEVLAHDLLYGCTHSLFEKWYPRQKIGVRRADFRDAEAVAKAVGPKTRVLYCETPVNPTLDLVDLAALARVRDAVNKKRKPEERLILVVDSTFGTPFCQRPLEHGADVVVHSLTKNIGGFGTEVGGAVICPEWMYAELKWYRKDFGGVLNAKTAWSVLTYGVPTLPVRLKRQQYSARQVAQHLETSPFVRDVRYPGLDSFPQKALARRQMTDFDGDFAPGNMIYFNVDDKKVDPIAFVDDVAANAYSITLAVSLGHTKTLIEMPSAMTHSAYMGGGAMKGVNGIRLSIGLESPADICRDLDASFGRAALRKTLPSKAKAKTAV